MSHPHHRDGTTLHPWSIVYLKKLSPRRLAKVFSTVRDRLPCRPETAEAEGADLHGPERLNHRRRRNGSGARVAAAVTGAAPLSASRHVIS